LRVKYKATLVFLLISLFIVQGSCKVESSGGSKTEAIERIVPLKAGNNYNATARFLAGLPDPVETGSNKITGSEWYKKYKKNIDRAWSRFFQPNMDKIKEWRGHYLLSSYSSAVFYPFSGPDVLNPLLFYPDTKDILMFGLEPTGGVPDIKGINAKLLRRQSNNLLAAINFTLDHAFFVTTDMQKKLKRSSLSGISGIMFFFLARGGYTIVDASNIYILRDGSTTRKKPGAGIKAIEGVEIIFSKGAEKGYRRARYFRMDISNKSRYLPRFSRYLNRYGTVKTIVKSASYLMTWKTFSKIRNLLLAQSSSILQDDSGIPYRYFKTNSTWKLSYFGKYHRPIPVFKKQYQKQLHIDVRKFSKGPVPFVYGYGYGYPDMTYHLLLAEKKKHITGD